MIVMMMMMMLSIYLTLPRVLSKHYLGASYNSIARWASWQAETERIVAYL